MGMLLSRYHDSNSNSNSNENEGAAKKVAPSTVNEKKAKSQNSKANDFPFTASEIKAMNGAKLRKVAKENGVSDPEELTVGELKAILSERAEG